MVWESGCVVIVMLTPLSENGVRQCYHYWPDEGSNLYHIYEVLPGRPPGRGQGALAAAGGGPVLGRHWAAVPASPQEVCPALRSAGPPDSCATGTLPEMVWFPFLNSMNPNLDRKHLRKDLTGWSVFRKKPPLTLILQGPPAPGSRCFPGSVSVAPTQPFDSGVPYWQAHFLGWTFAHIKKEVNNLGQLNQYQSVPFDFISH